MQLQKLEQCSRALDPSWDDFQEWLEALRQHSQTILSEARDGKAVTPSLSPDLPIQFSETGIGFQSASQNFTKLMLGPGLSTNSSRYFGYIPGGGVVAGAFGDFLASLSNRYSGHFSASHGATGIENEMVALFLKELGMPQGAWGTLISGG